MEFRLLGRLEILDHHGRSLTLRGRRSRTLLALLLLHANQPVSVDEVVAALWDDPPAAPREALGAFALQIRRVLPPPAPGEPGRLATRWSGYQLHVEPGELDTTVFEHAVAAGRAALGRDDLAAAWDHYGQALTLWRGPALAEFAAAPFAQAEIARLDELRLAAREERAQAGLGLGRDDDLVAELRPLIAAEPLREQPYALLMLALYRLGRRDDALAAYQDARHALASHAGREPGTDLQRLERLILAQDPILNPVPAATTVDDGPAAPSPDPDGTPPSAPAAGDTDPSGTPAPPPTPEHRDGVSVLLVNHHAAATGSGQPPADPTDTASARIRHYGGQLLTAAGGRLLAVFGAGSEHPDNPERAVRAALEIRAAPGGDQATMGVATGAVTVTPAAPGDAAADVDGDILHAAVALGAAAPRGTIAVGSGTYDATRRQIDYRQAPPPADGHGEHEPASGPVEVRAWHAQQPHARTGTPHRTDSTGPLVERDREVAVLTRALERCLHDHEPQQLTLVGPHGLGKRRLVAELGRLTDQAAELVSWRTARVLPDAAEPCWPLAEIVRDHTGVLATDPTSTTEAKLAHALPAALRPDGVPDDQTLRQLLALLHPATRATPDTGPLDGLAEYLAAAAAERPLVMVVEHLHHAGEPLLDFLDQLPDRVGAVPLLVACTALPTLLERRPGWGGGRPNRATMTLAPLSPAGATRLLDDLLGDVPLSGAGHQALVTAAGGNPMFVTESVRLLAAAASTTAPSVPETLPQLLTARLSALPAADQRLLADAAVLGETGWAGAVAAVGGHDRGEVDATLRRLEHAHLVHRIRGSAVAGETEYAFAHPLVADAVYRQLPSDDRATRHRRAAAWLHTLNPEPADRLDPLVHHYTQALAATPSGQPGDSPLDEPARGLLRRAGDRAAAAGALRPAASRYRAALALWPLDAPDHAALSFQLAQALVYGEHRGEAELTRAREAFTAAGDTDRIAAVDAELAHLAMIRGDHATARRHAERVRAAAPRLHAGTAAAHGLHALELLLDDQPDAAITAATELRELALERAVPEAAALAGSVIGSARLHRGDLGGERDLDRALRTLTASGTPHTARLRLRWALGLWWLGELDRCAAVVADGRRAVPPSHSRTGAELDTLAAGIDCAAGRWEQATRGVEQLLSDATASEQHGRILPFAFTLRGRIRLGRGDVNGALDAAQRALAAAATAPGWRDRHAGMALHARALFTAGRRDTAASQVDILLRELHVSPAAGCVTPDLALVLTDLGRGPDSLPSGLPPSRWHAAAHALLRGDADHAAELYDELGSSADAACARLRAARRHAAAGEPAAARRALAPAVSFWRAAGADGHLRAATVLTPRL